MAKLIFKLRDVEIDELTEVVQLLQDHDIQTYETHAGLLGLSMPALWLHDDNQYDQARALLDDYGAARQSQVQAIGPTPWAQMVARAPLKAVLSILSVLFMLGLSLWPFIIVGDLS